MIVIKGPIVYINPDRSQNPDRTAILVGIASWGAACADPQYPSVSARITNALDWIQKETGKEVLFSMKIIEHVFIIKSNFPEILMNIRW